MAPGNPLDPEDFRLAMSEPFDDPILDEVFEIKLRITLVDQYVIVGI